MTANSILLPCVGMVVLTAAVWVAGSPHPGTGRVHLPPSRGKAPKRQCSRQLPQLV